MDLKKLAIRTAKDKNAEFLHMFNLKVDQCEDSPGFSRF